MGKILFLHFKTSLLFNIIQAFVGSILFAVLGGIVMSFAGAVVPVVFAHILAFIYYIVINIQYGKLKDWKTYCGPSKQKYKDLWYARLRKNKKTHFCALMAELLFYPVIAAVFVYFAFTQYAALGDKLFGWENLGGWLLAKLLSTAGLGWIIGYIYLFFHYIAATCKCGNVMSMMSERRENIKVSNSTESRTKSAYGTIGAVYDEDGTKVGDVKGTTGSYSLERNVETRTWVRVCRCYYCNAEKHLHESERKEGAWK